MNLNKEALSGLLFTFLGAGGAWIASGYSMGTAMRVGPGAFPLGISLGLAAIGAAIMLRGFLSGGEAVERLPLRPLVVIPGAMVLFALALPRFGLVLSCIGLICVCALAGRGQRPLDIVLLACGLAAFSVAVFVYGLRMPMRVWPA